MSNAQGDWIWFELMTTDPDAAQAFYAGILGWTASPGGVPGMDYRILATADSQVAGLMKISDDMAPGPAWLGYLAVDDVDASSQAIEGDGGAIHMPPTTLPGVGRMAMVADPQGVPVYLMRGESDDTSTAFRQCDGPDTTHALGHVVWCELATPDPDAAIDFHARHLGWRQEGSVPMGELGEYRFLHAAAGCFGAMTGTPPGAPAGWLFYFHVPEIDAAAGRIRDSGGTIVDEPMAIPGGGYALSARDPQGARFGLVGPRTSASD